MKSKTITIKCQQELSEPLAKREARFHYNSSWKPKDRIIFEDIKGVQYFFRVNKNYQLAWDLKEWEQKHGRIIEDRLRFSVGYAVRMYWRGNRRDFYEHFNRLVFRLRAYSNTDITIRAEHLYRFCKQTGYGYFSITKLKLFFIDSSLKLTEHDADRFRD